MGRAEYDPYGNLIDNTIPLAVTDRLFTGQIWEEDLGLYNYRARFYDPLTGSFTQPDSIVPDAMDPRAWNRFGYVYGNPANYVDPSGHIVETFFDAIDLYADTFSCLGGDGLSCAFAAYDAVALITPGLPASYGDQFLRRAGGADSAFKATPSCAFNSFTAGTMVHTEAGLVPIESIEIGDKVFAQDPETGQQGYFEVVALHSHPVDEVLRVTVDDDQDGLAAEVMEITPGHPVYVEGKGWVKAEALALGDRLRRADGGWARVLALERVALAAPQMVYNLTVRGIHTYFVLEVGVLVHNCSPTLTNGYQGPSGGYKNRYSNERFYGAPKGRNLDQWTLDERRSKGFLYVIDKEGNIRLGPMEGAGGRKIHHSHLVNGENVYGAGEIYFDAEGKIKVAGINSISGHYTTAFEGKPFGPRFRNYLEKLLTEHYKFEVTPEVFDGSMRSTWP